MDPVLYNARLRWNIFLFDYTFNKSTSWGKSPGSLGIAWMWKIIGDVGRASLAQHPHIFLPYPVNCQ
jgi:hypothetical protein